MVLEDFAASESYIDTRDGTVVPLPTQQRWSVLPKQIAKLVCFSARACSKTVTTESYEPGGLRRFKSHNFLSSLSFFFDTETGLYYTKMTAKN
jgi:hypothetical protein